MVDGMTYLLPATGSDVDARQLDRVRGSAPPTVSAAAAEGIPAARLSNIFVKQFGGAEWLKKGRPAHPGFTRIPELVDPPDSYALTKEAERAGRFPIPDSTWVAMTDGAVIREYRLVPDRDLNGAGLVYFANYPMFLDICERDVLRSARVPLPDRIADCRTLVRRQSAYLNNAAAQDTLHIAMEPWLRVVERDGVLDLHLHVNYRMHRQSDNRLMMVSNADKIVPAVDPADLPADVVSRSDSRSR
jgi:probable biosynthetic protein (TIGR04098 family)